MHWTVLICIIAILFDLTLSRPGDMKESATVSSEEQSPVFPDVLRNGTYVTGVTNATGGGAHEVASADAEIGKEQKYNTLPTASTVPTDAIVMEKLNSSKTALPAVDSGESEVTESVTNAGPDAPATKLWWTMINFQPTNVLQFEAKVNMTQDNVTYNVMTGLHQATKPFNIPGIPGLVIPAHNDKK